MQRLVAVLLALMGPQSQVRPAAAAADVDLGLFARVVTSDPHRLDGARAGRLEEFRAEDVFLTAELAPQADGNYAVPADRTGRGSIGLEWAERRVLRRLLLEFTAPRTPPSGVDLEYWSAVGQEDSWSSIGQTPWQGRWERLPAKIESQGARLVATIPEGAVPEFKSQIGVLKIRWLFPAGASRVVVKRPIAFGTSVWQTAQLRIEAEAKANAKIAVYNGLLQDAASGRLGLDQTWNTGEPLRLAVVCSRPSPRKADRTLLRFELPTGPVTVAVEDALATDGVYVRDVGLLVRRASDPAGLAEYRRKVAHQETILARVRKMPDQSLDQAMRALAHPIQNNGPTMLSLACDNEKFILDRDGTIRYGRLSLKPQFPAAPIELVRLDFGTIGIDTTVRPPNAATALPLQIGRQTFKKGLGMHASAELAVWLDGRYEAFESEVGVLPHAQSGGSVVFQVDVDGRRRFDSGVVRQGEPPRKVRVALNDAKQLVLRVGDAGDGILNDAAQWADARLIPAGPGNLPPVFLSDLYARQQCRPAGRTRSLEGRWLPIVLNTTECGGAVLRQRTCVAPVTPTVDPWESVGKTPSLGVAEFTLDSPGGKAVDVALRLGMMCSPGQPSSGPMQVQTAGKRALCTEGGRVVAIFDLAGVEPLAASVSTAGVLITGRLPAKTTRRVVAYLPAWSLRPEDQTSLPPLVELRERVVRYWEGLMEPAMQVEVPEPLLEDVYRATQVHCLMAARNEARGLRIAPWIASDAYGPLDTEAQPVILGMDLVGHAEFARRGLEYFISNYNADGLLVKGYTLMGTGVHLWTLAEHDALAPDRRWLAGIAPQIVKSCRWIIRQTEKTKRLDARGQRLPEYGLVPPGVLADWNRYAYYFYANAHFCAGLEAAGRMLAAVRPAEAEAIRRAAKAYREDVLRAFRWQRGQMPVVRLRDGSCVPPCPSSLYCYGLTREFFGGVSATGHDVEAGGNHLIPLGLLDPRGREADWIVNFLEDRWFLIDGIFGAYPAAEKGVSMPAAYTECVWTRAPITPRGTRALLRPRPAIWPAPTSQPRWSPTTWPTAVTIRSSSPRSTRLTCWRTGR